MDAIFGSGPDLAWYQECARAVLIFLYGLALVRIAGRRIFGKWSALDIVVSIIIGSNLSRALTGGAQLWGTLAATTLLVALHWVLARLVVASPGFSRIVEGRPAELARHGTIRGSALGAPCSQPSRPQRGAAPGGGGRHCRREDCYAGTERQDHGAETRREIGCIGTARWSAVQRKARAPARSKPAPSKRCRFFISLSESSERQEGKLGPKINHRGWAGLRGAARRSVVFGGIRDAGDRV